MAPSPSQVRFPMVGRPAKRSRIFDVVLCYRRPETFLEARRRAPQNFGRSISVQSNLARIIREQEQLYLMRFAIRQLDKLMLDITDRTAASVADEITAWFEQSGTLCVDDKVTKPESVPW